MPIPLGILAAAGFRPPTAAGAYELIETYTVGSGGIASVTFDVSSYSTTYQHLQIRATVRDTYNNFDTARLGMRFNGDTAANYSFHGLFGRGSSVASFGNSSESIIRIAQDTPTNGKTTANTFAAVVIDILDPYETSKYTTARSLSGFAASDNLIAVGSGSWRNTNAVSSITLSSLQGTALGQYSRFSIYGLKAS